MRPSRTRAVVASAVALLLAIPAAARADGAADEAFKGAKAAFAKRDYERARAKLGEVLAADPDRAPAKLILGLIAFYFGDDRSARDWLEKATVDRAKLEGEDDDFGKWTETADGLRTCLENPFAARFGEDASKLVGKTRGGHYLLATDCGAGDLAKLKPGQVTRGHSEIGALLEKIYESYSVVFPFEKDRRLLSRVIVFDRREDYGAFTQKLDPEDDGSDSMGYYQSYYRLLVIANDPIGAPVGSLYQDSMDTMFHEGFHQFLDYFVADAPYWFNEGIAEYFGPSEIVPGSGGRKLRIGVVVKERGEGMTRYAVIRAALAGKRKERPTPIRELLKLDGEAFMKSADLHYAESWSFVHFLMHGSPAGKGLLLGYFKALRAGKDADAAFDETFGKVDLDALEAEWKKYVEGL
jgi:tetratricopeptide (TPR) repeat protein